MAKTDTFDDYWAAAMRQALRPEVVLPRLIAKLLRESGITLSAKEIADLGRQMEVPGHESLTINVDDSGHIGLTDVQPHKRAEAALSRLGPAVNRFKRSVLKQIPGLLNDVIQAGADKLVSEYLGGRNRRIAAVVSGGSNWRFRP